MVGEFLWLLLGGAVLGGSAISQRAKANSVLRQNRSDPYSREYYKYDWKKQYKLWLDSSLYPERIYKERAEKYR